MAGKLWDGRFAEKTDKAVEAFSASIDLDKRLYDEDIRGSIAHVTMLARAGVVTEDEASAIVQGLGRIKRDIERDRFEYSDNLEDIHMHVENRLTQDVGKTALKLHTARSRNDQVALDEKLYMKKACNRVIELLVSLRRVIVTLAEAHLDTILPGYTHLQRAQPVLLAHHLMAYYEMFTRDTGRVRDALARMDEMPLGAGALAGTTFPIEREFTAELLEFPAVTRNSMDTVSDRDFLLEFLSASAIIMVHLSRISEELVLWSSTEFAFVTLPDAFATGSSIMPQKKNPDIPELVRGKTGRVFGSLMALLTVMKGLPLAYNRDMQEDKLPMLDTVDTVTACLDIYVRMLPRLSFNTGRMAECSEAGFLNATDMADYLAEKGLPFREAHAVVGRAVAFALSKGKEIHQLTVEDLKGFSNLVDEDLFEMLKPRSVVNRRNIPGGTAKKRVAGAVREAKKRLDIETKTPES